LVFRFDQGGKVMLMRSWFLIGWIVTMAASFNCVADDNGVTTSNLAESRKAISSNGSTIQPHRLTSDHLPNPVLVHPNVISGGLPVGDAAFKELADRGIKTIVSVDGMKPDVQRATKYGMRYVHLPHGYDGVPTQRAKELGKAVRDLPGPIYIHCHLGKHRSPTAASVACVAAGMVPPHAAVGVLEVAGTDPHYRGLFQSARDAKPMTKQQLDAVNVSFRSVSKLPPFAEAMVDLEHTYANVLAIADAGWQPPQTHPGLDPSHQTLLLREHFTEMLRTNSLHAKPEEFRRLLIESEKSAKSLQTLLRQAGPGSPRSNLGQTAANHLQRISDHCKACHVQFRDVPLGEK
jgi:protein tyrosine phosphatase (PTP) superfamily phosphohydrolase (DUF442 family)